MNAHVFALGARSWRGIVVAATLFLVQFAAAVDIQPVYDANITAAQKAVIEKKIELWEARLPHQDPEHVVTITFVNADLGAGVPLPASPWIERMRAAPGLLLGEGDGTLAETSDFANDANGRPTSAKITINNNPAISWHEGLEPPVPADKYDLYTVMNHEIVHALGFTVANPRFARNVVTEDGQRKYEGGGEGGQPGGNLTPAGEGTHIDPASHPDDLMNPELPKGVRRTPSQMDIDILLDDVWAYPVIQGSLSNFDVWNRCGVIANDFQVTLGGILASSIQDIYNGFFNPFSDGVVTQNGNSAKIKWGPGPGQVNPGQKAHFGFTIAGDLTPLSFVFEWTQNNVVICTVPVSGTTWRTLQDGSVQNRVTNSGEQMIWVVRRVNISPGPIVLDDLLIGTPLEQSAFLIDPQPLPLWPGESVEFVYPPVTDAWGMVMIVDLLADQFGLPGEPIGTWLDAARLAPQVGLTGDVNCDGVVDFGDINAFVLLLSNPSAWQQLYPDCPMSNGDIDGNGVVDFGDINPFVLLLSGGQALHGLEADAAVEHAEAAKF